MSFHIQKELLSNSAKIIEWPLSTLLLKNEQAYRWFLLVPRKENLIETTDLTTVDQIQLMREVSALSTYIQSSFSTDKINVASIGNRVPQLHIHVVGRFKHDPLWPESIWQKNYTPNLFNEEDFAQQAAKAVQAIKNLI